MQALSLSESGPHEALGIPCSVCHAEFGEVCKGWGTPKSNQVVHLPRSQAFYAWKRRDDPDTEAEVWE